MSLFQIGPFTLPSGLTSHFKIECDALTDEDWASLAKLAAEFLMPFHDVQGVPRGGVPFAYVLMQYRSTEGGLLLADDVWVSGLSMNRFRDDGRRASFAVVAFARGPVPPWVTVLFNMDPMAEAATYRLDS